MDAKTLASLEAALESNLENGALLGLVLGGQLELGEAARALVLVKRVPAAAFSTDALKLLAARAALGGDDAGLALERAPKTPEGLVVAARAHLKLGQNALGLEAYRAAVADNPTLEDTELVVALGATVREVPPAPGGARLRVIANDDTDAEAVQRLLGPPQKRVTFADVGGLDEVKAHVTKRIVLPFQKPSLFQKFKKRVGGGILLYGPPGCGKTLLARATAGECKATFFAVSISDVLDMWIGESERKLHALFEKARASTPAVLFFDELEALAGKRQYQRESTSAKLVSQFLSEMDGFAQNNANVLILGATNVPWAVDAAFRRPGRFDRVQFVPPPDLPARESILRLVLANRPVGAEVDVKALAQKTSTFTGADLEQVVETAADLAIARSLESGQESPITQADLLGALDEVKPTALEWLTTARNYARYANESGHYDDVLRWLEAHGRA